MGRGMMHGHGPGYGIEPGMSGRYGAGDGLACGYGSGMGPGMMGFGYGYDPRDLTPGQREAVAQIEEQARRRHWALMQSMHELRWSEATAGGRPDAQAARKAYDAMAQLHRQMFETSLEARRRIENVRAWN